MRKLQLAAFIGSLFALTGCCDCFGDEPLLKVRFENFSTAELKTIYLINNDFSDTCFHCIDTVQNEAILFVNPNSRYQLKSDSIGLNRLVEVKKIKSESSGLPGCSCHSVTEINYDYEGNSYTNEPIVISR